MLKPVLFEQLELGEAFGPVRVVADDAYVKQHAFAADDYHPWSMGGTAPDGTRVVQSTALLAEVDRVAMRGAGADAADWARAVAAVERAGRVVDAVRIAVTAPAVSAGREVPAVVQALGARSGVDAVAQLAGVSEPEARRRLTVAATTTNEVALSGAVVPPRMCQLAQAMREGRLGVEAAAVIVRELDRVRHRVPAEDVQAAEEGLVVLAAGRDGSCSPIPVEFVNDAAKTWVAAIDPDGTRPREQRMMRRRSGDLLGQLGDPGHAPRQPAATDTRTSEPG